MIARKTQMKILGFLFAGFALILVLFAIAKSFSSTPSNGVTGTQVPAGSHEYTVVEQDNLSSIAKKFNLEPQTILWANEDKLHDDPHQVKPGVVLRIPAVDGLYYRWQQGDNIEEVASRFGALPQDVLDWPENMEKIGAIEEVDIQPGTVLFIPGGSEPFQPVQTLPSMTSPEG